MSRVYFYSTRYINLKPNNVGRRDDMWGRDNNVDNPDEYGGLNKADIGYAVRKFLNDASDYAEYGEYNDIKRVMTTFMEYVEEL